MSETALIYCRLWPVTAALSGLLSPAYRGNILPLYSQAQLAGALRANPDSPVVLGFNPHEHVAELYHLRLLLSDRRIMFVAPRFYWTDRRLPIICGIASCQFSTWDSLCDPLYRRSELRHFMRLPMVDKPMKVDVDDKARYVTGAALIRLVNMWLCRQMAEAELNKYEIMTLLLLSESRRGKLTSRALSYYKNRGMYKLGMTGSLISLYRGVKVRTELQAELP
ncbi:hypothetical protein NI420_000034 [Salmonella enterica]|nr:hypothetical protein [Salmonella enterica]EJJ4245190.1 hypothetical protein [Salmonella enterica]